MKIPYLNLSIEGELFDKINIRIQKIFKNGQFILGEELDLFEKTIAKYIGTEYAIGVNSGYSALVLALKSLSINEGDEVITVSNTFIATISAIEAVGAKPVFVDVGKDGNIDPLSIETAISEKTKCVLPVHLAGIPCNMGEINRIAQKYNLYVVEDAAQSIGTEFGGQKTGSLSDVGCFSLHPTKVLGACGDAGFITTNDKGIYESIILMRNHGLVNRDESLIFGDNSRLDEIQAAILNEKLYKLENDIRRRQEIAFLYSQEITNTHIKFPAIHDNCRCTYFSYVIRSKCRDKLMNYLRNEGIDVRIHYPVPLHKQPAYKNKYGSVTLPETEIRAKEILSLPCNSIITDNEIKQISQAINSFQSEETI